MSTPASATREERTCDECGSCYFADASAMAGLCPECAHRLYGYPACTHEFHHGRCHHCGWDGSCSPLWTIDTGNDERH